ncbi:hypothetical protein Aperf_G00000094067 [Anoplocephala perfoliata]
MASRDYSYSGHKCSAVDRCLNSTCAAFATCHHLGKSFICICDDTSGERCEEGYDPCKEHICEHNGTCVRTGEHMNFADCVNCSLGWGGQRCERKLNACELETLKLGHSPCCNDGDCLVDPTNETTYICLCDPDWQGNRSEFYPLKFSTVAKFFSVCLLILTVCCIFAFIYCCRIYVQWKIRMATKNLREIKLTPSNSNASNELSRMINLYEIRQDQVESKDISYVVIWKQSGAILKSIERTSPADDQRGTMLDRNEMVLSAAIRPKLVNENGCLEPLKDRSQNTLNSEARGTSSNQNDPILDVKSVKNIKRSLPSTPTKEYNYEVS